MDNAYVTFTVKTEDFEELKRIFEHHIDWVIDFDSNKDIINYITNVKVSKNKD